MLNVGGGEKALRGLTGTVDLTDGGAMPEQQVPLSEVCAGAL